MNPKSMPPQRPEGEPPGRPGRKLGPISDAAGAAHRAWLEPLRTRFLASCLTISGLSDRTGFAKSKISELLRGAGLYPRWEITYSVLHVLDVPTGPMRRLWTAAAYEVHKKPAWVNGCIATVALSTGPAVPPLDLQGFMQLYRAPYTRYAQVFLRSGKEATQVVSATFDILWLRWEEALGSSDVQKFAWSVLRVGVMARTPHIDGHPELVPAAFETVILGTTTGSARFDQIEESMGLFKALSRLPDHQLDIMVLKYLRGMDDTGVADVLGVPVISVWYADRYAKQSLTETLGPHDDPGGTSQ